MIAYEKRIAWADKQPARENMNNSQEGESFVCC
jgi:hypothetical protein